jgi:hypothetical protein
LKTFASINETLLHPVALRTGERGDRPAYRFLAKRFHLDSGSLVRYLKESGTPLLAIPIPDAGKDRAFFLRKEVAVQIQMPSRRMLREAALRRIVATRKEKWVEYRQAKETTLGRPMRRVRANCRHSGNG